MSLKVGLEHPDPLGGIFSYSGFFIDKYIT